MNQKLDLTQKITCNTVAKTFELAAESLPCYETTFCKQWLTSNLCKAIQREDPTVICQSRAYFYDEFVGTANMPRHEGYQMDADVMFWAGYLFTYWMYAAGITGEKIASTYSIRAILEQYDTLHTLSVSTAIETIEQHYTLGKTTLDSVLYR